MIVTAWDPGDTTGFAIWNVADGKATPVGMGQCSMEGITEAWKEIASGYGSPDVVIVEDFRLFRGRAVQQAGSQMKAPQGIGSLRTLAELVDAQFVVQPANIKATAKKQAKITIPSDHSLSHEWDAYLHGFHWLLKNKYVTTQLAREKANGRP